MKYCLFILIGIICPIATALPPANLTCVKEKVIAYYQSAAYEKDVQQVVDQAITQMLRRVKQNAGRSSPKKLAVVFDIDDTAISNYQANKQRDFINAPSAIEENYRQANSPAIKPMLAFYRLALKHHVAPFFISYRPSRFLSKTIKNLHEVGFKNWQGLYLANTRQLKQSNVVYKASIIAKLRQAGYQIIIGFGDQASDLQSYYAEHLYRIPNPLYTTASKDCPVCKRKSLN